jgi:hypothetical protein
MRIGMDSVPNGSFEAEEPAMEIKIPASRIRPRMAPTGTPSDAYRNSFSCENRGKYFRSSKRRIQW